MVTPEEALMYREYVALQQQGKHFLQEQRRRQQAAGLSPAMAQPPR